jgi:MFS family permease
MLCFDGTRDGDLYLQLASGRFIAGHGLSAVDPFRTIAHGDPWLNQQWLPELLSYQVVRWIGVTGLTVAYAGLLAAPLALLLWLCRRKGVAMMAALAILYCPGLWVIVHPRAAGFSVLAFSILVAILVTAWLRQRAQPPGAAQLRWAVPATLALFALWANLHGGFVAGLLLIGVASCGLALERGLGIPGAIDPRRIGLLALTGVLAAATMMVATPLGSALLSYLASFRNPAISLISSEWRPAFQSPLAIAYIGVATVFAGWLLVRARGSRPLTPALVVVAFMVLAIVSLRNIIFVGPVLALAIALLAPDGKVRIPWPLVGLAVAASAGAAATWAIAVGPVRNEPTLDARLVDYALRHPPRSGHIATYAGVGSYMLWRSPRAPVELDGWLEHFSAAELRGTYTILDGRTANPTPYVRGLRIGAVIADRRVAIEALRAHGFAVEFRNRAGAYLVKDGPEPGDPSSRTPVALLK